MARPLLFCVLRSTYNLPGRGRRPSNALVAAVRWVCLPPIALIFRPILSSWRVMKEFGRSRATSDCSRGGHRQCIHNFGYLPAPFKAQTIWRFAHHLGRDSPGRQGAAVVIGDECNLYYGKHRGGQESLNKSAADADVSDLTLCVHGACQSNPHALTDCFSLAPSMFHCAPRVFDRQAC